MELKEYIEEILSIINIKSVKKEPLENAAFGEDTKNGNPHGYDEYIPLEMIKLGIEIYAKSILRLSSFV